jgi:uncharacterized protein YqfA (UPF0365 family)
LVGGAPEETILARVGEGIVTTIGSAARPRRNIRKTRQNFKKPYKAKSLDAIPPLNYCQ